MNDNQLIQEAERLYPYVQGENAPFLNGLCDTARAAHISCARQYISEIERMGSLCMEKDGRIEQLENEIAILKSKVADCLEFKI